MWLAFEIEEGRSQDRFARQTMLAWRVVTIYTRTLADKKVPSLKSLLAEIGGTTTKRQSTDEIKGALSLISAKMSRLPKAGGPRGRK